MWHDEDGREKLGENGGRGRDTQQARQTTGAKFRGGGHLLRRLPNECALQLYSSATGAESCISPVPTSHTRDRQITPHLNTRFRDTSRLSLPC
jgi:hypothetical protein